MGRVGKKTGPITSLWLANQIRGFRIPARSDAWEKKLFSDGRTMSISYDVFIFLLTEMNPRIDERTAKSFNSRVKWVEISDLKIFVSIGMFYINKHNILSPQYPFRQKYDIKLPLAKFQKTWIKNPIHNEQSRLTLILFSKIITILYIHIPSLSSSFLRIRELCESYH